MYWVLDVDLAVVIKLVLVRVFVLVKALEFLRSINLNLGFILILGLLSVFVIIFLDLVKKAFAQQAEKYL